MKRQCIRWLGTIAVTASAIAAPGRDPYAEIRALIREAENAAVDIACLDDGSRPSSWVGGLYARAGYLDDAARAFGPQPEPPYLLWKARALYGDLAGAEKMLDGIVDPERKAAAVTSLGVLLWRMGQPEKARVRFEAARKITASIPDPERRKRALAPVNQGLAYLSVDPVERLSPAPKPRSRPAVQNSSIPPFPITTDGFRDRDMKEGEIRASVDAEFMTRLYDRMAAGDRDGLLRTVESATTPFQKVLALASIEHILIQASQPEAAEQYALKMPDADPDCALAKAEALSAAGAAWLRAGNAERAHVVFEAAAGLVGSTSELPLGKVLVMISIATAQFGGGLVASGAASFKAAIELAQELPVRPLNPNARVRTARGPYRDEAYRKILLAAVRARDLGTARRVAALWSGAGGKDDTAVVRAWLDADRTEEAVDCARKIADTPGRVKVLLVIAQELLDKAGAPNF